MTVLIYKQKKSFIKLDSTKQWHKNIHFFSKELVGYTLFLKQSFLLRYQY